MQLTKRILVSVTNKGNLKQFRRLFREGWEVVSTGGTATALEELDIDCTPVEKVTGFPEMMDGRLKTLHPKIFGGILGDQNNPDHIRQLLEQSIGLFGAVAVNLYNFERKPGIENIDIGGPSLLRAAGKNHSSVAVLSDPEDYEWVIDEILDNKGNISIDTLEDLALKAFEVTADYDAMIADWMRQCKKRGVSFNQASSAKH